MPDFGWNYPPGVTGNEYAIAGADYEKEVKGGCRLCTKSSLKMAFLVQSRYSHCFCRIGQRIGKRRLI